MSSVGSYVFFDIETTGLPHVDLGKTKITEMTLIGVARSHFDKTPFCVPRVVNTLTLCLNPQGHIGLVASKITGLTNDMLDVMGPFDEKVSNMMISFIERLPQPACLLSHNGDRFDFPILQSHLKSIKMALPDTLLCGDTLKAFRDLNVMDKDPSEWKFLAMEPFEDEINKVGESLSSTSLIIDEIELSFKNKEHRDLLFDNDDFLFAQIDEEEILSQQSQYSTPVRNTYSQVTTPIKNRNKSDVRSQTTPVKRKLFGANSPSYKLESVHKHVTGDDISNAHSSQSDTLAMLTIVSLIGNPFHNWLLQNCVPFSTIKQMW